MRYSSKCESTVVELVGGLNSPVGECAEGSSLHDRSKRMFTTRNGALWSQRSVGPETRTLEMQPESASDLRLASLVCSGRGAPGSALSPSPSFILFIPEPTGTGRGIKPGSPEAGPKAEVEIVGPTLQERKFLDARLRHS
mmetsp:Transcript_47766/g.94257  ORF Transcript_47766/g.94257 Transcript_47766/m.94257 type:complete len:140 (-) Transcript_47766:341-760(-)